MKKTANNTKIIRYIALIWLLIGVWACNKQPKPLSADYYEHCDTNAQGNQAHNSWLQKQWINIKDQMPQQKLKKDAETLLNALQKNDFNTANQYATKNGLGTLLYIDIDQINNYQINDIQIKKKKATAHILLNQMTKPIRFSFTKTDSIWKFEKIYLEDVDNGTPHLVP